MGCDIAHQFTAFLLARNAQAGIDTFCGQFPGGCRSALIQQAQAVTHTTVCQPRQYPCRTIVQINILLIGYILKPCCDVLLTDAAEGEPLTPGQDRSAADFFLERNDALIIESFGVGGLPEAGGFYDCVRSWMDAGRTVVLTTQVANEGSDLGVYHVGHALKNDLGVLEAYDMTCEAVTAKLMWILGQTRDREAVERMFYTPVAKDILWPVE